jgi:hypothetical protein
VSQCIAVVRTDGSESVYTTASADLSPSLLSTFLDLNLPVQCRAAMKSRRQPMRASDDVMYRRNDVELGADYALMPYGGARCSSASVAARLAAALAIRVSGAALRRTLSFLCFRRSIIIYVL